MSRPQRCEICLETNPTPTEFAFQCGCKGIMHAEPCMAEWIRSQPGKCPVCMKPFNRKADQYDMPPVPCYLICALTAAFCVLNGLLMAGYL